MPWVGFALCAFATQAAAQTRSGSTPPVAAATTEDQRDASAPVSLRVTLLQGYDDNAAADIAGGVRTGGVGFGGPNSTADANLRLHRDGRAWTVDANADSDIRYYPGIAGLTTSANQATLRLDRAVGSRARFGIVETARYAPLETLSLFGADSSGAPQSAASALDAQVTSIERMQSLTRADFEFPLGRRTTASLNSSYGWQQVNGPLAVRRYGVGGRVSRDVKRHASLSWTYDDLTSDGGDINRNARVLNAAMTFSYDKPLSAVRHLMLQISGGDSVLTQSSGREQQATVRARVARDLAHDWTVAGEFGRQFLYFDWIPTPVFANRASADATARIGRRTSVQLVANYAANAQLPTSRTGFDVYWADAKVTTALTPTVAVYGEYGRYRYRLDEGVSLATADGSLDRNVIRGGVALVWPIVRSHEEAR